MENKQTEGSGKYGKPQGAGVRWALGSLALAMLLSSLGISIPVVALPKLAEVFSASYQEVQWIVIAYLLAITITSITVGRIGDLLGRRRVLLAGLMLFTLASILCALASNLWVLIVARALQGFGAAILMSLTVALVRETVSQEKTGSAMGMLGTMSAIGTTLGPSLGGVLIDGPGWWSIFLVMAAFGVVNTLLAIRYLPFQAQSDESNRSRFIHERITSKSTFLRRFVFAKGFDIRGTLILSFSLAAFSAAMTVGEGRFDAYNVGLMAIAGVSVVLFVYSQKQIPSPLIQLAAFRNVVLSSGLIMNAIVATIMMSTLVVGPFYLSRTLGLSASLVGLVMSVGPILSALSGVPAGRIVDRFGASSMVLVGLMLVATGSFALSQLPELIGVVGYIAALALLTPGYQLFQAANNTAVVLSASDDEQGVVSGMLGLSRNLGLIMGSSAMGAIFVMASGTSDIALADSPAVAGGFQTAFRFAGGLAVVTLVIALAGHKITSLALRKDEA